MQIVWSLILVLIDLCLAEKDWGYLGSNGPNSWPGICLTGKRQSPVLINSVRKQLLKKLHFFDYDETPLINLLENSGQSIRMTIESKTVRKPRFFGGDLCPDRGNCTFQFGEVHFHWGSRSDRGAEHIINGKTYPLEAHLVHFNQKYKDLATAMTQPDGLAVLAVLFHLQPDDNPKWRPLTQTMKVLSRMRDRKWIVAFRRSLKVSAFLPKNRSVFYRYQGSLTNPGCQESVVWTIFAETEGISENQLFYFRSQINRDDEPMVDNFRPPQPLNGRIVYFNLNEDGLRYDEAGGQEYQTASTITITDANWCKSASTFIDRTSCLGHLLRHCPATCYKILLSSQQITSTKSF